MFPVTVLDSIRLTKRFYSFAEGYSVSSTKKVLDQTSSPAR